MNYLLLFAILLWVALCIVCIKICYGAIRYKKIGTAKQWGLAAALTIGTLAALHRAIESLLKT